MNVKANKPKSKSRRKFLIRGGIGTVGLIALGTYVFRNPLRRKMYEMAETMVVPYSGTGTEPNLWLEVTKNNNVILHSPKVEMGQGTFTGLAQIVADEFDVNVNQITVTAAETATGIVDGMSTGGSLSVAQLFNPLRQMAATMREFIKIKAADQLGVVANELKTQDGIVSGAGKALSYADILAEITEFDLPDTPELRPVDTYKYIGQPVPRIDLKDKVIGSPIFGLDATMPDMLYASVVRPEHIGASIKNIDYSDAEQMPGVVKVMQGDGWVGIMAHSFAEALAARRKMKIEWDIPKIWSEESLRDYLKIGEGDRMITQKEGSAIDEEEEGYESLEFFSPIGAHAQIEPNGALAFVKDGKAVVELSTQVIGVTQKEVAEALGFDKENVNIKGTFLGGGFGRRLATSHAVQAALMSKEIGRPVKYVFTRKEEFQNDWFRPPTQHIVKGKMSDQGVLEHLEHHYASGDVAINSLIFPPAMISMLGTDVGAMRGGNIMYDKIENKRAVQWHKTLPFATSFWRSLGLLANTFAIESFIDEMALKAGKNPVEMRLNMLSNEPTASRIAAVIKEAAAKGNYQDTSTGNRAKGFAASIDAGAPCAMVVDVSVEANKIKVHKVTSVFDCGLAVNPDQVKAQCEGCVIMGLSASLYEKMTIKDGRLYPINYGAYQMAMMKDVPREIDIHLIQGVDEPLPVGEPPLGPIAAAVGNAVRRITGNRPTELPINLS